MQKYVEMKKKMIFLENETVTSVLIVQMFYSPMGYLASIMFWIFRKPFLFSIEVP